MTRTAPTTPLVRSMEVRASGTNGRMEFTGIGVPFNERIEIDDWFGRHTEEFEPGSIELAESGAKIFWQHGEIIGHVAEGRDAAAGYELDGKISDTTLGRDAYTMLRDGTIDKLSIGFQPLEWREDEDGHIVYTKVRAVEFSLVSFPAYSSATINEVRTATPHTKGNTMPQAPDTLTRDDLAPITAQLAEMERGLALANTRGTTPANPLAGLAQFRSIGGLVRAVAQGSDEALTLMRAFTEAADGGTLADSVAKDSWVGNFIKLGTSRRKLITDFGGPKALPETGMNVEFGRLKSDTTKVEKQAAEAANLAFGKIELTSATAPVETYGGWSALSRQVIERSRVPYLDTLWEAMSLRYGRVTEAAVRAVYAAMIAAKLADDVTPNATVPLPAAFTATNVLDSIVDLAEIFDDRGYQLSGLHVSKDVFKKFNALTDGDSTRLMTVYGNGTNQVGSLDLSALTGNIANLAVRLLPGAAANTAVAYDPVAVSIWENPGAPLRLQDENIVNLTKDFSLYGYLAAGSTHPDAIVPLEIAAV